LLSCNDPDGICLIDTCNLDGETNLKVKQTLLKTLGYKDPSILSSFQGEITCDLPNNRLKIFKGKFSLDGNVYQLIISKCYYVIVL
jgi:magnesium-transporting ATPase (P-type)